MRTILAILTCLTLTSTSAEAQRRVAPTLGNAVNTATPDVRLESTEPLARLLAADCDTDRTRGREAASHNHSGSGWMIGGFASGIFLGLIGTAISYALASSSTVEVNGMPEGVEPACYRDGYAARAKSTNTSSALTGGLLGTAVLVILVVSATSGSGY
jgi:hypothetical protein